MKILVCLIILCLSLLYADNINYTNWTVEIEIKKPVDDNSAVDSIAKALIKNIYINANQKVQDYLKENSKLSRQFDRMMLKSRESNIRYLSDGSTIFEYEIPITGFLLQLLMPTQQTPTILTQLACPLCVRPWPDNTPVPESVKLIPVENELTPQYTAVLIDARDIMLNPALFPKIFNEDSQEVYGVNFAVPEYLESQGLVTYMTSLTDAFNNDLLGINPLRITALKSTGEYKTDIVISNASAKMMHSSQNNLKLLEQCKVVVVTGE